MALNAKQAELFPPVRMPALSRLSLLLRDETYTRIHDLTTPLLVTVTF
jgi:hypothetical protein